MSLLEYDECLALTWSDDGDVYALLVKQNNHKFEILNAMHLHSEEDSYATIIAQITEKLLQPSTHLIIAGGAFKESVCFDLSIPKMSDSDIRQAIQYELPRYIPNNIDDLFFGYRILPTLSPEDELPKILVRVFVITKKVWHELLTDFSSAGVKLDLIVHPFMIVDPILEDEEALYLKNIDSNFKYEKVEGAGRQMVRVTDMDRESDLQLENVAEQLNYDPESVSNRIPHSELESYIPVLMEAAFALGPEFRSASNSFIELPKELILERFRFLRNSFFLLLIVAFFFVFAFLGRAWWEDWSRLATLKDATKKVNLKLDKIRLSNNRLSNFEDGILTELQEANVGNENIAHCFHKLSVLLPKKTWLINFSVRNNTIAMTIKATPGQLPKVVKVLNSSGIFKTKSPNKRANSDGTESLYIDLIVTKPSFLKGGK